MIEIFTGTVTEVEDTDTVDSGKRITVALISYLGNKLDTDNAVTFLLHVPFESDVSEGDIVTQYISVRRAE